MTTFSDLISEITESAAYALLRAAGNVVNVDYEAFPDNSPVRTIVKSTLAPVIADVFSVVSDIASGGFLDFAPDGPWLNALGEQMFGTPRILLTFASCQCTFTNTSAEPYSFANRQVIVQNSVTKKTYYAPAFDLAESGADGDEVTVTVTAVEPGTVGNADAGDIDTLTTNYDGVTVINTTAAVGTDEESKAAYVARCRLAAAATSPAGAAAAYEYVALSATRADGTAIGITKVKVNKNNTTGQVSVVVADEDGPVAGADVTHINDLLLETVVPHGIDWQGTSSASTVVINVEYTATALASEGLTADEINDLVERDLAAMFASSKLNPISGIGGFIYHSKIRAVIEQVREDPGSPEPMVDVTLNAPAGASTAIGSTQVAALGAVIPHITLV